MSIETQRISPLSPNKCGTSYSVEDLPNVFKDIVEINKLDLAKYSTEKLAYGATLIATHSLKMLSPSAKQGFALKLKPVTGVMPRVYHTGNGAAMGVCALLTRPIAIDGTPKARSLSDHILVEDEYSATIFTSFAEVFGKESLQAVIDGVSKPCDVAEILPAESFPIVYVPGPDGRELQLTPIVAIETHINMADEFYPVQDDDAPKRYAQIVKSEVSTQQQNISGAILSTTKRMLARFPEAMKIREADVYRVLQGGHLPAVPADEIKDLLSAYVQQYVRLIDPKDGEQYIRHTADRMAQMANSMIDIMEAHLAEIRELCAEVDPSFELKVVEPLRVLTGRIRGKQEEIDLMLRALRGKDFQTVLEKRGY